MERFKIVLPDISIAAREDGKFDAAIGDRIFEKISAEEIGKRIKYIISARGYEKAKTAPRIPGNEPISTKAFGYTKAWKVMTPSIAKNEKSFYWDWTSEYDGIRIFEVLNSDKTGYTSYSIVRITRDTEAECDEEFEGQITDGYFENYRGNIRGREISADNIRSKGGDLL